MKLAKIFYLAIIILSLQACASAARPERMIPIFGSSLETTEPTNIVVASVAGGSATNPLWTSQVDSSAFNQALNSSLSAASLQIATAENSSAYVLEASLNRLSQPLISINTSVTSEIFYKVTKQVDGSEVFAETVTATGTASFGEALLGGHDERVRLANEYSIRENIRIFIERLVGILNNR